MSRSPTIASASDVQALPASERMENILPLTQIYQDKDLVDCRRAFVCETVCCWLESSTFGRHIYREPAFAVCWFYTPIGHV